MSGTCYRTGHYAALMKASARLPEAREFIFMFDAAMPLTDNAGRALAERWYGNASPRVCRELTRFFSDRFIPLPGHLSALRRALRHEAEIPLPVLNHFYMILRDPYYRWAAADWLPSRIDSGLLEIPRNAFETAAREVFSGLLGPKSANRYCRNILTALRDNGYLTGQVRKTVTSPALPVMALGFLLYTLKDLGEGFNDFDGSPLFRSLLKPRELLVPLFKEGEKRGWWEFTGDHGRLSGTFSLDDLDAFLEEAGA